MRFPSLAGVALLLAACGGAAAPSASPVVSSAAAKPSTAASAPASAAASAKPAASASSAAASGKPAASGSASAAAGTGAKVRIGQQGLIGDAAIWIGLDKGFFKEQGIDLELVPFTSAADTLPSLTSGQVDFGTTAANAAMFNAAERAVQIKFVADMAIASPNTKSAAVGIRSDLVDGGKFKGPADLKGLNIAVGGPPGASTIDVAVERYASKGGLSHNDLKETFLPFPQMPAAIANKAVDAAYFVEPFLSAAEQQGSAKMVAYNGELLAGYPVYILAISPVFAQNQAALADKFMQALVKSQRYTYAAFKSGANQADAVKSIQDHQQIKDGNLIVRMMDDTVSPDNPIDLKPFTDFEEAYTRYGSVKQKADINQLVDTSYLQRAVAAVPKPAS